MEGIDLKFVKAEQRKKKRQAAKLSDDYTEFIQLCLICLGHLSSKDFTFKVHGPVNNVRWMAKAI